MDKPGPGPDAARQPLIIERSDLAHPLRRGLELFFTALAWCAWLLLWMPLVNYAAGRFGLDLPWAHESGERSAQAIRQLIDVFPLAMGVLLLALLLNGVIGWTFRRFHAPTAHATVDIHQMAAEMALDEQKLASWQGARIIRVEHDLGGRVVDAQIIR